MTSVEIEEAQLQVFGMRIDETEFPLQSLWALGAKEVTLAKLRSGNSNASDVSNGLLQRNNIQTAVLKKGTCRRLWRRFGAAQRRRLIE